MSDKIIFGKPTKAIKYLLIINCVVFFLQILFSSTVGERVLLRWFSMNPNLVVSKFYIWQPFTYMFFHRSFLALIISMFILWLFGREIERSVGSQEFYKYYLICGVSAAIFNLLILFDSYLFILGSSGATFGVVVGFAVLFPQKYIIHPKIKAANLIIILVAISIFFGIFDIGTGKALISHLGGMLVGYFYSKFHLKKVISMTSGQELVSGTTSDDRNAIADYIMSENKFIKETDTHSEYQISKKFKPRKMGIWIISAVEILGGSFGILVVVMLLLSGTGLSFLPLTFFVFQVVAGVLLWKNNPLGLTLSRVAQIMQIPYISISQIIHYSTIVGVSVFTSISFFPDGGELRYGNRLGAEFNLIFNASLPYTEIGFNIVALVFLVYLIRYRSPQSSYQEE